MTPGQSRVDLQVAKAKTFSLVNELRTRNWFPCWCKNICSSFLAQTRQGCDVVGVSVREENELYIEFVAVCEADHFAGSRPSIKGRCGMTRRVPTKIRVDSHTVIIRVELREAVMPSHLFWVPFAFGQFAKGWPVKTKDRRNIQEGHLVEIALAQLADCFRTDVRFFGERRIR